MEFAIKFAAGETELGEVKFAGEVGAVSINGQEISTANAEWLVKYGLRKGLADSYAGKMGEDASKEFAKRLDKLMNGAMSVRQTDVIESLVFGYARTDLTRAIGKSKGNANMSESTARKAVGKPDVWTGLVNKYVVAYREAYESRAREEVARRMEAISDVPDELLADIAAATDAARFNRLGQSFDLDKGQV